MKDNNSNLEVIKPIPQPMIHNPQSSVSGVDMNALFNKAVEQGSAMEVIKELSAMEERIAARRAKSDFDAALTAFQSDCPIIEKKKAVMNKDGRSVRYHYAPLDSIVSQVQPILERHGIRFQFTTCTTGPRVKVLCKVDCAGHSETSEFESPIDPQAFMNEQQKFAAALTYAKRYAFCNALGILTGDEDVDGETKKPKPEGASSLGGAVDDRDLKWKLVDFFRTKFAIQGRAITEDQKAKISQDLIDEGFITPDETLATLAGKRLAEVVAKLEARSH